jgi:signal transduction histidine kinase/ligand-binding sensor domain-containing protein/AraC-like DNA-binding protein
VALVCFAVQPARGVEAAKESSPAPAFRVQAWGVAEGLPGTHVNGTVQDDDGYLWIATLAGLARFDGSHFEVFDETAGVLPSNRISFIHRGPTGKLWIGTNQGYLIGYWDHRFHRFGDPPYQGSRLVTLAEDAQGTLWASRDADPANPDQPLVCQLVDGRLVPRKDLDRLWIAKNDNGRFEAITHDGHLRPVPDGGMVVSLSRDADGAVWGQLSVGRQVRLPNGAYDPLGEPASATLEATSRTLFGRARGDRLEVVDPATHLAMGAVPLDTGYIWLVDRRGLTWASDSAGHRLAAYRSGSLEPAVSLEIGSTIRDAMEDREGNLWLSTMTRGLLRVAETPVVELGPTAGIPLPVAVGATSAGIFVEAAPVGGCRPLFRVSQGPGQRAPELIPDACSWLMEDRRGVTWTFDRGALVGRRPGQPTKRLPGSGSWMVEDPEQDGVLWLADTRELRRVDTNAASGPTVTGTWPLAVHRAIVGDGGGGLWIATNDGLYHLRGDRLERLGREDGLPVANIRAILADQRGGLWLGTYGGGLVHYDGNRFVTIDRSRGLPENIVASIFRDAFGAFWLAGNQAVHRVLQSDLEACLAGRLERVSALSFGVKEGLANPETTGRPPVLSPDGRIWLATFGGLVVIDPAVVARQENRPPTVLLTTVESAGEVGPPTGPRRVPADASRSAAFAFTAFHLSAPQALQFRYRLEPLEPTWVAAGAERHAEYRGLPPGHYRFRVQARHSAASWVEAGTTQELAVAPRFRETVWFPLALGAVVLALVVVGWRWSTYQVRLQARHLEAAVRERTRTLAAERDVVARQAAALGQLAEGRARFMAAISHELRTPLTLLLGPLQDLLDARLGALPETAVTEVAATLRSARRLHRLVDRLLEVARSEAELTRLRCREIELVAFARKAVEELQPLALRRGSRLLAALGPDPAAVWFDPLLLETVLINLVANALKHTPVGTTVEVHVASSVPAEPVALIVRDDGPGIPADDLPRLFERFFRGRAETNAAAAGFGLGLALVKEVVERHGGRTEVTSDGHGTTFTVHLRRGCEHLLPADLSGSGSTDEASSHQGWDVDGGPLDEPTSCDAENTEGVAAYDDATGEDRTTVLVVDDNAEVRRLLRRQLQGSYRVLEAAGGGPALAMLARELPDLVLSDVMMPGLDGYELCHAIRGNPETDFIPVVLLTAKAAVESRIEGLRGGADAYLAKPFDANELLATIDGLIATRRRLRDRLAAETRSASPPATAIVAPRSALGTEPSAADRDYLTRLDRALDAHLHDDAFAVDELADAVGQSRVSLYRHVKRLLQVSPSDLLRDRRLAAGSRLLAAREGTVSEVAYAVGFKSTAHFSNSFLARYGVRPSSLTAPTARAVEVTGAVEARRKGEELASAQRLVDGMPFETPGEARRQPGVWPPPSSAGPEM